MSLTAPVYSTLFHCLHDQQDSTVPAWSHHSIFRSVEYRDVERKLLEAPIIHDFAVLWDDDHDTRVIEAIERIYMAGLLTPVQFIGEHKGTLTVIIAARSRYGMEETAESYGARLEAVATVDGQDQWPVVLGFFDRSDRDIRSAHQTDLKSIIGVDPQIEMTFLRHLDSLWSLGSAPWKPPFTQRDHMFPPIPQ